MNRAPDDLKTQSSELHDQLLNHRGLYRKGFWIIVFVAVLLWSAQVSRANFAKLLSEEGMQKIARFLGNLFPPDLSPDYLSRLIEPTLETIGMSILGTVLAVIIALPLAFFAASNLSFSGILNSMASEQSKPLRGLKRSLYWTARLITNVLRAVPELMWALVFIVAVGLGAFPGVLAIAAHTGGTLGKVYAEFIESSDGRALEALQSTGASKLKIVLFGVIPEIFPQAFSYTLYRWECNIRASMIMGFVGAGGLGLQINFAMSLFRYQRVMTLIIIMIVLVTIVDRLSAYLRTRIIGNVE